MIVKMRDSCICYRHIHNMVQPPSFFPRFQLLACIFQGITDEVSAPVAHKSGWLARWKIEDVASLDRDIMRVNSVCVHDALASKLIPTNSG